MSAIQSSISCLKLTTPKRRVVARRKAYTTPKVDPVGVPLANALLRRRSSEQIPHVVLQAMNNDLSAQAELFTHYRLQLYRRAYSILRNREDAEDALQDCWLRALSNLPSFRGRSSFSTWLTRIVITSALMILRKKRRARQVSADLLDEAASMSLIHQIPDASPNPEQHCAAAERRRIVNLAIRGLAPRIKAAVELGQLQELSLKETARGLGISVSAAKARLFHARVKLSKSTALSAIAGVSEIHGSTFPRRGSSGE